LNLISEDETALYQYFVLTALLITLFQYIGGLMTIEVSHKVLFTESLSACLFITAAGGFFILIIKVYNYFIGEDFE
jgi:hypothetical protein